MIPSHGRLARVKMLGAAILAASILGPGPALGDEALRFSFAHELFWHGFPIFTMETVGLLDGERYTISATDATVGIFDIIVDFTNHAESRGDFTNDPISDPIRPFFYRQWSHWRGNDRHVSLDYGGHGPAAVDVDPPPEKDGRDPVPASLQAGTIDPLSASVLLGAREANGDPCHASVPVYDGRQRYNFRIEYLGTERIEKHVDSVFGGEAIKCQVTIEHIAGFMKKYERQPPRPPATLWLARFADGKLLLPVQLEAETRWGTVVGYLTRLTIGPAAASARN